MHALDTNVVLYHLKGQLAEPLPSGNLIVSIVTEIELLAFGELTPEQQTTIMTFLSGVTVVDLSQAIKSDAIWMRLAGLRLPDAVIAATAAVHGAVLLTHDARLLKAPGIVAQAPALKP